MGGLIFGWNALSVMLKGEGVFAAGCDQDSDSCSRQDSKLNTVWTAGVFAVNFGLAFAGASLDYIGPKFTSSAGAAMTSAGLIALGTQQIPRHDLHQNNASTNRFVFRAHLPDAPLVRASASWSIRGAEGRAGPFVVPRVYSYG